MRWHNSRRDLLRKIAAVPVFVGALRFGDGAIHWTPDEPMHHSIATAAGSRDTVADMSLDGMPELVETLFPDLAFLQQHYPRIGLAVAGSTVVTAAHGEGATIVAADVTTGTELWRLDDMGSLIGLTESMVILSRSGTDGASTLIEARSLVRGDELIWTHEARGTGPSVVADDFLVQVAGQSMIALRLDDGTKVQDTDAGDIGAGMLIVAGDIVVGLDDAPGTLLRAWDFRDGGLLWSHEAKDLVGPGRKAAFVSPPALVDDVVIVATPETILMVDLGSGELLGQFEHGGSYPNRIYVTGVGDTMFLGDLGGIQAFDLGTGERVWSRRAMLRAHADARSAGSLLLQRVDRDDSLLDSRVVLEGIDALTGDALFELPSRASDDEFSVQDYAVVDGALVIAGKRGMRIYRGSGEPFVGISTPGTDAFYASEEHGFRYEWDDSWTAVGTSFMTPDGLQFAHAENGAAAAQYVQERELTMDENLDDLTVSYPVLFGPDTRYLRGAGRLEAPDVSRHLPEGAEVMLGRYETTFNAPFDVTLCLTVGYPLGDERWLVFEFMTAESQFDRDLPSFWTFFEQLMIR